MNICQNDMPNINEVNIYLTNLLHKIAPDYIYFLKNNCIPQNNKFRILYVCNIDYLICKMSRVRFWAILELAKRPNISMYFFGKGWTHSNPNDIKKFNPNFIIWYKPLDYDFSKMDVPTCIRYNEMWDEKWTREEIDKSQSNLIICHHKNDWEKYVQLYADDINKKFVYIPHHANPEIFYNQYLDKDIDILIAGVIKEKHYPLKRRLYNLITQNLQGYNVHIHQHPKYIHNDAYTNRIQKEFAELINRSKIVVSCTSAYKYRLGKYVEIPMCGSVILGDIPYEDAENFRKFVLEVNMDMSDDEILQKIKNSLANQELLYKCGKIGEVWSQQYTTAKYVDVLYKEIMAYMPSKKIYIISDEIKPNHPEFKNEKWICDNLKKEFMDYYPDITTNNAGEANIIWYLAPWNYRHLPVGIKRDEWDNILTKKSVIFTMHHIDEEKYKNGEHDEIFEFMRRYGSKYHAICERTRNFLDELGHGKQVELLHLWIDNTVFYEIADKKMLREKWGLRGYVVGSFQKDTEGKTGEPKLSKGPDIFANIVEDMQKEIPDLVVVLTGTRRSYLIGELERRGVAYKYFEMVSLIELNELYNCLDLYLVSSRVEGGPRAVFEAGITKTPIITTDVGIASDIMPRKSIYNWEDWKSYKEAKPDIEEVYRIVEELEKEKRMGRFKEMIED